MAQSNGGRSMAAPLSDCTIKEQRTLLCFLWAEEVKSAEIHHQILAQYGACTMHQQEIYKWIERFKEGRTSVTDESQPGRPSTSCTDQHIQRVDVLIREDRWLTLAHVADILGISYGSAQAIMYDDLRYHKVCAWWVPKQLTAQHKQQRVDVATQFLQCYEEEPGILQGIVTGDEIWVHHYKPDSKGQSMEWKHPSSPVRKKSNNNRSTRNWC
jgi:hypothetical protein